MGAKFTATCLALLALCSLIAACVKRPDSNSGHSPPTSVISSPAPLPQTDPELVEEAEAIIRARACRGCHRPDDPDANDAAVRLAPPLARIAERRPGDWLRRFLRYPYPIRPNQRERMPQLGLSDREIEVLAGYLELMAQERLALLPAAGPAREEKPRLPRVMAGRRLFIAYNCMNCHSLGKHQIEMQRDEEGNVVFQHGAEQAPDLTNVWQRVRPQWLLAMIQHPPQWMPWSRMPELNVAERDVDDLAWFLMNAIASPATNADSREIEQVLKAKCAGCHSGENAARGLDLTSLAGLRMGAVDDLGRRRPSAIPYAENSPLLRQFSGDRLHPRLPEAATLTQEEMASIEGWILAGAHGLNDGND